MSLSIFSILIWAGIILWVSSLSQLNPKDLLISTTIDSSNKEIIREGIRLLKSIEFFGGRLNQAHIEIAIPIQDEIIVDREFLDQIIRLNNTSIRYCMRYSKPKYSPTLNKFCSFTSPLLLRHKYFLYLDADIFVTKDPWHYLENELQIDYPYFISCGRPWNSFIELNSFYDFLMSLDPVEKYRSLLYESPLLETYSFGGSTYYGLCNTGVYFMRSEIASSLATTSLSFLSKLDEINQIATKESQSINNIFNISFVNIDSLLIWASQYYHGYSISIFPPSMNYLAPIEEQIVRFIDKDLSFDELTIGSYISFVHFSHGSDLYFKISTNNNTDSINCFYEFFGNSDEDLEKSLIIKQLKGMITRDNCLSFYEALRKYQ